MTGSTLPDPPAVEKRILPLLDVSLVLIGIFLVLLGIEQASGDVVVFELNFQEDKCLWDERVIGEGKVIKQEHLKELIRLAKEKPNSEIHLCTPRPSVDEPGEISNLLYQELKETFHKEGIRYKYKPI
jgi:hypothetical protein